MTNRDLVESTAGARLNTYFGQLLLSPSVTQRRSIRIPLVLFSPLLHGAQPRIELVPSMDSA